MRSQPKQLVCVGKDLVSRTFVYIYEDRLDGDGWDIEVSSIPASASGVPYQCSLLHHDATTVRQAEMHNNGVPEVSGKGIPDALLPEMAVVLQRTIISSWNKGNPAGIFRTPDACKVWKRLQANGKATYDPATDIFTLL
jgi:hypothetical protein